MVIDRLKICVPRKGIGNIIAKGSYFFSFYYVVVNIIV